MVKTIAVSDEMYDIAMAKKREMEVEKGKVIRIADAVDVLFGLQEKSGKNRR